VAGTEDVGRTAEHSRPSGTRCPKIIDLRPTVVGTYVSLRCGACEYEFESYQPTLAGMAVGMHTCPKCSVRCVVLSEDFDTALAHYLPSQSVEYMADLTKEATRIAETWHRHETLARLLTYRGIPLGPATERELLASVTLGLVAALKDGKA
jgi:hypothetical protein